MKAVLVTLSCLLLVFSSSVLGQQPSRRPALVITKPPVSLVDQFGILSSEERSSRFDALFNEISRAKGSVGYVFLYCGKRCRYGEIEAHQRGIEIKVALRGFDRSRLIVVNAGFRENFETELWLALDGTSAPQPKSSVNIKSVEFSKPSGRNLEYYECCDDLSEIWKALKP